MKKRKNKTKISKLGVHIDKTVSIGAGVVIHDNVSIKGNSVISEGVEIFSGSEIYDSKIGNNTKIRNSLIEESELGEDNVIGPFARLRKGTRTGKRVYLGSFVEVKNSYIDDDTKASHLAYIGDATIGKKVNVGCGVIFANYNGKIKQHSEVGDFAFLGSNSNIIAPVRVGEGAYICAGTTVTRDVEKDEFVIGRVRQEGRENLAKKFLKIRKDN